MGGDGTQAYKQMHVLTHTYSNCLITLSPFVQLHFYSRYGTITMQLKYNFVKRRVNKNIVCKRDAEKLSYAVTLNRY